MPEFARIIRFVSVGIMNTAFGYASYALLIFFSAPLWIALISSLVAAFGFNFVTYGGLVFKNISRHNLPKFLLFYSLTASANYLTLRLLDTLGIKPIWAQALLLPLLALISYLGLRFFVFRADLPSNG